MLSIIFESPLTNSFSWYLPSCPLCNRCFPLWKNKNRKVLSVVLDPFRNQCDLFGVSFIPAFIQFSMIISIPVVTYMLIAVFCLFIQWFLKTRLGQNMRAVGQNKVVANAAGINVDKVRIISIIISTVMAAFGQLIYLQNIGVFTTYGAHKNVALYSIAALLVGGASVYKATSVRQFSALSCSIFCLSYLR